MAARNERTALDLLEEATYLLRNAPAAAIASYYLGTLPFALAFLFFWADMGRSGTADEHSAPAALGVALLFLWMTAWQAVFAQGLRSTLTGTAPAPFRRLVFVQATLQPAKLIVLPVAALLTIPLASAFAFYQNLTAISYEESQGLRQIVASARRQASLWQRQNWIVLGFALMLAIVIFINIGVLVLLVPQLLKSFLGIETAVSRGPVLMLNSTFLAIAATLTYAIVDPVIKAVYVLRCFYGESLATGEDLKAQLKTITTQVALVLIMLGTGVTLHAQQPQPPPAPQAPAVRDVNRSIDDVLTRPEFSWRLPHRRQSTQPRNWFVRMVESWLDKLDQWLEQFSRWLHERFRPNPPAEVGKPRAPAMQMWAYILIAIALLVFLVLFVRLFRKRPRAIEVAEAVTTATPDLASEETTADQLPADEWLRTARECIARNDLRLAVRALYLANLAYLGGRSLIAIDRGKSNNDYARELRRRARAKPEIVPVFHDTIGIFERSWYGMYNVTSDLVAQVESNLTRTRASVEQ